MYELAVHMESHLILWITQEVHGEIIMTLLQMRKLKLRKVGIYSKAPSQKLRSKNSNLVFLFENQPSLHTCLLGQAAYVKMEGSHHPCIIKKTKKQVFLSISLRNPAISTTTTSTLLISKLCSHLSLTFYERIPVSF